MEPAPTTVTSSATVASAMTNSNEKPNSLNLANTNPNGSSANTSQTPEKTQQRKKSIKMSNFAKSLSNIFSSKHSDEKSSPEKQIGPMIGADSKTSPTKDVNVIDRLTYISEDNASVEYKRKDTTTSANYVSPNERRNSKGETSLSSRSAVESLSSGYLSMRGVDAEFDIMLRNFIAQHENKKNLPVLVDNDYNDYTIDGYAQNDYTAIDKSDESLPFDEIQEEEIVETSREYSFYAKQFQKKEHINLIGKFDVGLSKSNLFVLSVKLEGDFFSCILRTKDGNFFKEFELRDLFFKENNEPSDLEKVNVALLLKRFNENMIIREIAPVNHLNASHSISAYDKQLLKQTFTFGIIYQKYRQVNEKEIFSNSENSKEFEDFLNFIGQRVSLKNFKKFRGGLDVIDGATGSESVYEFHDNAEIMFHVSTFLPHSEKDQQYVERKRHIGNDRVAIVFQDQDTPFSPKMIKSKLLHVFMIIQPVVIDNETKRYKVSVISKKDVPEFEPFIRAPCIFQKDDKLKKFIVSKLINAEYASLRAPAFSIYSEKTLESSLQKLYENLILSTRSFITMFTFTPTSLAGMGPDTSAPSSLLSESSSHISNVSASNSSRLTVKGAFRKLSTHYFKAENNPYLMADPVSGINNKPRNLSREEEEDYINRSKDSTKKGKTSKSGKNYERKSSSKTDIGSNDCLSDSSLHAYSSTTVKSPSNDVFKYVGKQSESVENLDDSSFEYENNKHRQKAYSLGTRLEPPTGVIVSGSGPSSSATSIKTAKAIDEDSSNHERTVEMKIAMEKDSLESNFANAFNKEMDDIKLSEEPSNSNHHHHHHHHHINHHSQRQLTRSESVKVSSKSIDEYDDAIDQTPEDMTHATTILYSKY